MDDLSVRPIHESFFDQRLLWLAFAVSFLLHLVVLLLPAAQPRPQHWPGQQTLMATLLPRVPAMEAQPPPPPLPPEARPRPKPAPIARQPEPKRRILAMDRSEATSAPRFTVPKKWTQAEKREMDDFLADTAKAASRPAPSVPTLADLSLKRGREFGRTEAVQQRWHGATVERIPNTPPPDEFSVAMYFDALVKKLNRSSAFVHQDKTPPGRRTASLRVRVLPDGSLGSIEVLNVADQKDQVKFIEQVVKIAAPFARFSQDMKRSASAVTLLICIRPPDETGTYGFSMGDQSGGC